MREGGLSSVVGMLLLLVLLAISASVLWANYVPYTERNAEIELNEKLEEEFLKIPLIYSELKENETKDLILRLGGKETNFGFLPTTSTFRVNRSGELFIEMSCEGAEKDYNFSLFSLELYIHNSYLPLRKFVFSEGGLKIFQLNRNLTKIGPLLEDYFEFGNGTLFIRVPTLSSKPSEVSGTGFAYLKLKYLSSDSYYINCSGSLKVKDAYFESFWHERMKEIANEGNLNFDNGVLSFENVNVSISAKEFQIALT